jgi:hypothetical protein
MQTVFSDLNGEHSAKDEHLTLKMRDNPVTHDALTDQTSPGL